VGKDKIYDIAPSYRRPSRITFLSVGGVISGISPIGNFLFLPFFLCVLGCGGGEGGKVGEGMALTIMNHTGTKKFVDGNCTSFLQWRLFLLTSSPLVEARM
jgi:hypothetical protein